MMVGMSAAVMVMDALLVVIVDLALVVLKVTQGQFCLVWPVLYLVLLNPGVGGGGVNYFVGLLLVVLMLLA